ncbi:hypothetical protein D3C72_1903340 [compost metagenome]
MASACNTAVRPRGQRNLSSGASSNSPHSANAARISKKAKGLAWARPSLETIAPLLQSRTNRLVVAAEATDSFERANINATCIRADKPNGAARAEQPTVFSRVQV